MPDDPFVVHVAQLLRAVGARRHEVRRGPARPEDPVVRRSPGDSGLAEDASVWCDVVLESFAGGVTATGTLGAPWTGLCCRCAVPVGGELRVAVRERFSGPGAGARQPRDGRSRDRQPRAGESRDGHPGTRQSDAWQPRDRQPRDRQPRDRQPRDRQPRDRQPDDRQPDDDEAYGIAGGELDLWPMIHDALVLELPLAPLCRADCRGLCPGCGVDWNEGSCACVAPADPRWASLDVLRPAR